MIFVLPWTPSREVILNQIGKIRYASVGACSRPLNGLENTIVDASSDVKTCRRKVSGRSRPPHVVLNKTHDPCESLLCRNRVEAIFVIS